MRTRLRWPSPALVLAFGALMVALGGTAWAAATVVNIADPTTPANKAHVDSTGALKTAGTSTVSGFVGETAPKAPLFTAVNLFTSSPNSLILANKATVAITRVNVENFYGQAAGETARISLIQQGGNDTTCDGSSGQRTLGSYEVDPGESFSDSMGSPIVLKPLVTNDVWCLLAFASLKGSPTSYILPVVSWSGYVVSGTLPNGSVVTSARSGAAPRRTG